MGFLLQNGAEIHAKDRYGSAALHLAAGYGRELAVQLLLKSGAKMDKKNGQGSYAAGTGKPLEEAQVVPSTEKSRCFKYLSTVPYFMNEKVHSLLVQLLISSAYSGCVGGWAGADGTGERRSSGGWCKFLLGVEVRRRGKDMERKVNVVG